MLGTIKGASNRKYRVKSRRYLFRKRLIFTHLCRNDEIYHSPVGTTFLNEKPLLFSGFFRYRRNPRRVCVVVRPSVPVRSGVCPSLQVVLSLVSYLFRAADVHFFRTFSGCFSIVLVPGSDGMAVSHFRHERDTAHVALSRSFPCTICPVFLKGTQALVNETVRR